MKAPTNPPSRQLGLFDETAASPPKSQPQTKPEAPACNYWDFCPNCGTHLYNAGCKYRCPKCHYFMSCSDFD